MNTFNTHTNLLIIDKVDDKYRRVVVRQAPRMSWLPPSEVSQHLHKSINMLLLGITMSLYKIRIFLFNIIYHYNHMYNKIVCCF